MKNLLTTELLKQCLPFAKESNINKFLDPLNATLEKYEINTPERVAAFLAQIAHESGSFRYVEEIASGKAYEGRIDLGNTIEGDGVRFKGRGLIQITGRSNYYKLGQALNYDFINNPEDLKLPGAATMSAGWFWNMRKLNDLADLGTPESFRMITKKINGGYNGLADRVKHWKNCKRALNILD